jgi:hypothetical protein
VIERPQKRISLERAKEYEQLYHGCAPTTYVLIADELGLKANDVFQALIGLSGGVGLVGTSACGAVIGLASAISQFFGITREQLPKNLQVEFRIHNVVRDVVDKFKARYGGITCYEVQLHLYGKAFDLYKPDMREEFAALSKRCPEVICDAVNWVLEQVAEEKKC